MIMYLFFMYKVFLKFPFEGSRRLNAVLSGIEGHTFGPINVSEHFPEEELTVGKNRLLEVDSLWSKNELS